MIQDITPRQAKTPITLRLNTPVARTLRTYKGQNLIVEQALTNHPGFREKLEKEQEVYDRSIKEQDEASNDFAQDIDDTATSKARS